MGSAGDHSLLEWLLRRCEGDSADQRSFLESLADMSFSIWSFIANRRSYSRSRAFATRGQGSIGFRVPRGRGIRDTIHLPSREG